MANLLTQLKQQAALGSALGAQQVVTKKSIPVGYRVTPDAVAKAEQQGQYVRVGFKLMSFKKASGLIASWDAKPEYTSAEPAPQPQQLFNQPKPRKTAVGKGLDNVALKTIFYVVDGAPRSHVVRVTGKWLHVKNYLVSTLGLDEATAVWNLTTQAFGIHNSLSPESTAFALGRADAEQNNTNRYDVMIRDLKTRVTEQAAAVLPRIEGLDLAGKEWLDVAGAVRTGKHNEFLAELRAIKNTATAVKEKTKNTEIDFAAFVALSGVIPRARFYDKNGTAITRVSNVTHTKESIAQKLRAYISNPADVQDKFFDITNYEEKGGVVVKRPKKGGNRSKKVAVQFVFENHNLTDHVYTSKAESVAPALIALGFAENTAKSVASSVKYAIDARKEAIEAKKVKHGYIFIQSSNQVQGQQVPAGVLPQPVPQVQNDLSGSLLAPATGQLQENLISIPTASGIDNNISLLPQ